jgi:hypothetical protein
MPMEKKSLAGKKNTPATKNKTKTSKAKVDTKKPASGKVVAAMRMVD